MRSLGRTLRLVSLSMVTFVAGVGARSAESPTPHAGDGGALSVDGGIPTTDAGISSPVPRGALDKEIIRRVIRRKINTVTLCYEQRLASNRLLAGRIMVQFTIAPSGKVVDSRLASSTIGNAQVDACIVAAVRSWEFPKPIGGGNVIVSYPFVLAPQPSVLLPMQASGEMVDVQAIDAHAFVVRTTIRDSLPANALLVLTDKGLILVDTGWTERETELLINWSEGAFKTKIAAAVVTHDHPDRVGGIKILLQRKIPTFALDLTVRHLEARGIHGVSPLFSSPLDFVVHPLGFEAFYPGPGHAPDNIVVAFPDLQLLAGGCLIKSTDADGLGYTKDADLVAWPRAVARVSERYPKFTVIPGHGRLQSPNEPTLYAHTLNLLAPAPSPTTKPAP